MNWSKPNEISTSDLIELISWKGGGDEETDRLSLLAYEVFHGRFAPDLTNKCEIMCANRGHSTGVALLIVERTLRKFVKSKSFDLTKSKVQDVNLAVQLYLNRIAFHELVDYHRELNGLRGTKYTGDEDLVYEIEDLAIFKEKVQPLGQLKKIHEVLKHAISGLNQNQKLIYLTYFNAKVTEGEKPPRHLTEKLRKVTGLTQNSIRSEINRTRKIVEAITKVYAKEK